MKGLKGPNMFRGGSGSSNPVLGNKVGSALGPKTVQVLHNRSTSNKICHYFKIVDENGLKNTGKTFKLMDFPKIAFVFMVSLTNL